jgi:hypothetical protein
MKIYIFERISQVSGNWHPEGGLVIIANDIEEAKQLIAKDDNISPTDKEWETVESFEIIANEPKYWVMPDAGCC